MCTDCMFWLSSLPASCTSSLACLVSFVLVISVVILGLHIGGIIPQGAASILAVIMCLYEENRDAVVWHTVQHGVLAGEATLQRASTRLSRPRLDP